MRVSLGAVIGRNPFPSSTNNGQNQNLEMDDVIIRHGRKCRDLPFLVFFIAFLIALIVNSSFGFFKGNPLSLQGLLRVMGVQGLTIYHVKSHLQGILSASVLSIIPLIRPYQWESFFMPNNYKQMREQEYPDLPSNVAPPNDAELWERSVGGQYKGRIFGFGSSQDPRYSMTGHLGAGSSGGSHHEEEWHALKEEVRQEKEARLKQEEEMRKEREARLKLEERQKVFEAFMKRFNDGNLPLPRVRISITALYFWEILYYLYFGW